MSDQSELRTALLDTGLNLIAKQGWHRTTILQIAAELGAPVVDSVRVMPGKIGLLVALFDRIDEYVDEQAKDWGMTESAQDRFFDATMARFEAMQVNREGVVAVLDGLAVDPVAVAVMAPRYDTSLGRTLACAGLAPDSVAGVGRRVTFAGLMMDLMRVWVEDESEDMAATMAALGKRMEQANELQGRLRHVPQDLTGFVESSSDG